MEKILIVGGGYAGFYTAWGLEKRLRRGEAEVTLVDPRPYMTYQPFLPEVAAGSVEARHAAVSLRSAPAPHHASSPGRSSRSTTRAGRSRSAPRTAGPPRSPTT